MPNIYTDWFVGAVAILLGLVTLWHALKPSERTFEFPKLRWLERTYGRTAARAVLGTLGAVLIALGVEIALGWKMQWEAERQAGGMLHDWPQGTAGQASGGTL